MHRPFDGSYGIIIRKITLFPHVAPTNAELLQKSLYERVQKGFRVTLDLMWISLRVLISLSIHIFISFSIDVFISPQSRG